MPIVGAIVLLIQFCFAYHALKAGRPYWWVFIIMGFPAMGCVIYYFVEAFPGSREQRRAAKAARAIARALGENDAALAAYRALIPQFVGLEARYRYGRLLMRLGKNEAAMQMFNEVVKHARRYSPAIEQEEQWAEAAREAIAGH